MAINVVVSRGYGNGTYSGTIKDVVTRGYTIGTSTGYPNKFIGVAGADAATLVNGVPSGNVDKIIGA